MEKQHLETHFLLNSQFELKKHGAFEQSPEKKIEAAQLLKMSMFILLAFCMNGSNTIKDFIQAKIYIF